MVDFPQPSLFWETLGSWLVDDEVRSRLDRLPTRLNEYGYDDFGFSPRAATAAVGVTGWFYRNYFRVDARGVENIPKGRVLLIANHGGQLPVDGMMVATATLLEGEPPRMARAMVERWVPTLPFVSTFFFRCGQVVGNRDDCRRLLEAEEAVLVFPEGAKGSGKTVWNRYQLQEFGLGFMRLALETGAPIIPIGVVGSEESIPSVYDWKFLARLVNAPYLPIPATLPLLGPFSMVPLPTKFIIHFGEPMYFDGDPDASKSWVSDKVESVKQAINVLIQKGLAERKGIFGVGAIDLPVSTWPEGRTP